MTTRKHNKATSFLPGYAAHALEAVLAYLWDSERADYEQSPPDDRYNHIFRYIQTLGRYLEVDRMQRRCDCKAKQRKQKLHGLSRSSSRPK
jgi:hypothetical protein